VALAQRSAAATGEPIDDGIGFSFPHRFVYRGGCARAASPWWVVVLQMLLSDAWSLGARPAEPGEFTRRAFLNDKLDLAQAKASPISSRPPPRPQSVARSARCAANSPS